jgi:hypothetical protein
VAQNARAGAGAQRSRGLLDVASQEAGLNTGLRTQEATAGAGALNSLSGFYQNRADVENRVFQNYLQYRTMQKQMKADRKAAKSALIGDAIGAATEIGLAAATGGASLAVTQGRGISGFGQGPTQGAGRPPSYYQTFA